MESEGERVGVWRNGCKIYGVRGREIEWEKGILSGRERERWSGKERWSERERDGVGGWRWSGRERDGEGE